MNTEQVQERLEAIKERCEKATGGPWKSEASDICVYGRGTIARFPAPSFGGVVETVENRNFITNSRSDIPYLVSVIESLMEEVSDE